MKQTGEEGFSLIESLIVVSIIALMSALALQAIPIARSNQQMIADTEQIRALLLDAKERSLNQVRPDTCLPMADMASKDRAVCSDVGVAIDGNKLIEFADTDGNNRYSASGPRDYVITTYDLSATVGVGSVSSLVFSSVPPSTLLYKDGALMAPSSTAKIILDGYPPLSRTLLVHSYGTIDVE